MSGRLVFARVYSDPKMDKVRAEESHLNDRDLDKRFSDTVELMKCNAIKNGELQPDLEKTKDALHMVKEADRLSQEYGWAITVFRETGEIHVQIIPDSLLDIQAVGVLFGPAYRVSVDHCEDGTARFHFRYETHRYTGDPNLWW